VLCLAALLGVASANEGRCKISKVRAVCESRCEDDTRAIDRTSVPPPGTLLPPSGLGTNVEEGASAVTPPAAVPSPADSSTSLLELEAVTITKSRDGKFTKEDAEKAILHTNPHELSKAASARMLFAQKDMENLGELDMTHFAQLEAPPTMLHKPMSCDDVEGHINPAPLLSWADAGKVSFGCADGRDPKPGVFTWGGDFSEFVVALNVYEQMTSTQLSRGKVTERLRSWLMKSGREKFTTCISSLAIRQMFGSVDNGREAIRSPLEEKLPALMLKIADSNFVGNEHIKFMLEAPEEYSMRKELIQHAIRSFYNILWNQFDPLRNKLNVQVLEGDHQERAVVAVSAPPFCQNVAKMVPIIPPRDVGGSMVVVNSEAVQQLRKELSIFFESDNDPVVRADEMSKRLSVLQAGQAALTKKRMYDRIPTYKATLTN